MHFVRLANTLLKEIGRIYQILRVARKSCLFYCYHIAFSVTYR